MFVLDTDEDPAPLDCLMDQLDLHPDDGDDFEDAGSTQAVGMFFSYQLSKEILVSLLILYFQLWSLMQIPVVE